jgi:hypothetical protein
MFLRPWFPVHDFWVPFFCPVFWTSFQDPFEVHVLWSPIEYQFLGPGNRAPVSVSRFNGWVSSLRPSHTLFSVHHFLVHGLLVAKSGFSFLGPVSWSHFVVPVRLLTFFRRNSWQRFTNTGLGSGLISVPQFLRPASNPSFYSRFLVIVSDKFKSLVYQDPVFWHRSLVSDPPILFPGFSRCILVHSFGLHFQDTFTTTIAGPRFPHSAFRTPFTGNGIRPPHGSVFAPISGCPYKSTVSGSHFPLLDSLAFLFQPYFLPAAACACLPACAHPR